VVNIVAYEINKKEEIEYKRLREKQIYENRKKEMEEENKLREAKMRSYIRSRGVDFSSSFVDQYLSEIYEYCQLIEQGKFASAIKIFPQTTDGSSQVNYPLVKMPTFKKSHFQNVSQINIIVKSYCPYRERCAIAYGETLSEDIIIPWYIILESGLLGLRRGQLLQAYVEQQGDVWIARKIELCQPYFRPQYRIFGGWEIYVDISGIDDLENVTARIVKGSQDIHEVRFFNKESRVFFNIFSARGPYNGFGKVQLRVDDLEPIDFDMIGMHNYLVQSDDSLYPLLHQLKGGQQLFIRHSFNGWFEEGRFDIAGIDNALALFAGRLRTGEDRPFQIPRSLMAS